MATIQTQFETSKFVRKDAETHKAMHAALILDNSYNSKFCSDIAGVDFGKYKGPYLQRNQIPCLRPLFCDNVMFFRLVPSNTIEGKKTTECGTGTTVIGQHLREFCKKKDLKYHGGIDARRTVDLCKDPKAVGKVPEKAPENVDDDAAAFAAMEEACTKNIKKILETDPNILGRFRARRLQKEDHKYGYVSYKVPFAQYSYEDVVEFCTEYADKLAEQDIYVHEQDFTKDFGCSFNKDEMYRYLKDLFACLEDKHYLIDNDKTVGKNCLSFMHKLENCMARGKFYNKAIQSWQTRSIKERIGMHLEDWINNVEQLLRETMLKSLDYGFTRLEITFYTATMHPREFYDAEMEHLCNLTLGSRKMFKCPIADQWRALAEALTCNMAIIDLDTKEYALGMWCNTLTRRVGGVRGHLEKKQFENIERLVTWIAAHFSYDQGIINIATVKADACPFEKNTPEADKWTPTTTLKMRSFVKWGDVRTTFVPGAKKGCLWYSKHAAKSRYTKIPRDKNPQERGIVDCPNVQFGIFENRVDIRSKALCGHKQIDPICSDISTSSMRQRTKMLAAEADLAFITDSMAGLTIANKQAIADAAAQIAEARSKKQFLDRCVFKSPKSLLTLPKNTRVEVIAFKEVSPSYGSSYCIMDTENKPFRATPDMSDWLDLNKHLVAFDSSAGVYFAQNFGPVFQFMRDGNRRTNSGNDVPITTGFSGIAFIPVENDLPEPGNASTEYVEIPVDIRHSDAQGNVGDLLFNTTYTVAGIQTYWYRKIQKYMLLIDGKYYASNYWLEENLQKIDTETGLSNYEVLKAGGVQTTLLTYTKKTVLGKKRTELRCAAL